MILVKIKARKLILRENITVLGKSAGAVYRIAVIAVALAGRYYKGCIRAIAKLTDKKVNGSTRCIFIIKKVAAYKNVVYTAASDVFHHTHKAISQSKPALIALLGYKTYVWGVKMDIAAMQKFQSRYLIFLCHKHSPFRDVERRRAL